MVRTYTPLQNVARVPTQVLKDLCLCVRLCQPTWSVCYLSYSCTLSDNHYQVYFMTIILSSMGWGEAQSLTLSAPPFVFAVGNISMLSKSHPSFRIHSTTGNHLLYLCSNFRPDTQAGADRSHSHLYNNNWSLHFWICYASGCEIFWSVEKILPLGVPYSHYFRLVSC